MGRTWKSCELQAPAGPQLELLFRFWTMRQETSAGLRSNRHNLDSFHHPPTTTTQPLNKQTRLTSDWCVGHTGSCVMVASFTQTLLSGNIHTEWINGTNPEDSLFRICSNKKALRSHKVTKYYIIRHLVRFFVSGSTWMRFDPKIHTLMNTNRKPSWQQQQQRYHRPSRCFTVDIVMC